MPYSRTMPQEVRDKISRSMTGKKKTPNHIEALRKAATKAWQRVPLSSTNPEAEGLYIDVWQDQYGNKKFFHN